MNNQAKPESTGVSIVVSASSFKYADNIFSNYISQDFAKKELIIAVNKEPDELEKWLHRFKNCPMARVYQLDKSKSTDECVNYCIQRSIYEFIAIFYERNLYVPQYISTCVQSFKNTSAYLFGNTPYSIIN